jgi:alpha-tubulin suppressor-like RCC1 family protein
LGDGGAYSPSYLQSAYNTPSATNGSGQTVAIVDAYDDPNAEADLSTYRSHYELPSCTTANGCFSKVDEHGGTSYPAPDGGWALEISLDLDMVSAICPNCHILLVEADSNGFSDLAIAEDQAVALGAAVVSNSYGAPEFSSEMGYDTHYTHPGVAITVSSGDSGYGTTWPAASPDVTAVGGTSLNQTTDTGVRDATETTWNGSGSGCSWFESKPSWQHDPQCAMRTVADVSAVADPSTPVWSYDTYPYHNATPNWAAVGGTSAAAPIVAGVYALAGGPTGPSYHPAGYPYAQPGSLNDVTSGSNGSCGSYLCSAGIGYDGPTGLGTPNGVRGFQPSVPSAPQNLQAGSLSATTTLSWSAPAINGGSGISAYKIYRADQGGVPIASVSPSTTTYADSGLVNGTTYTYTVTAVNALGEGTGGSLSATPEPLDHLALSPANATVPAGSSQIYSAQGFDASGNSLGDETTSTVFSISPDGSCTKSSCSTSVAGDHSITGALAGKTIVVTLHVTPGPLDHLAISPATSNFRVGGSQTYSAQGFDAYGNSLGDVTGSTVFSVAPDGSCTGATCTATVAGAHTVTGTAPTPTTLAAVSVGNDDTCGTTTGGGVRCWGFNEFGELGNGTFTYLSTAPGDVSGLTSGAATVSAGFDFACSVVIEGGVKCWGSNGYGDLGDGTFENSPTPVDVTGLTSGVAAVSTGGVDACAVTTLGGVKCWGYNGDGELGNGTTTGDGTVSGYPAYTTPVDVTGLTSGVVAVSAGGGGNHTCALTTEGGVKCWGYNGQGQLGNGTTTNSSTPVDVMGLSSGVAAVSSGYNFTCALTTAGEVKCWGNSYYGELGNGDNTGPQDCGGVPCSTIPVPVSGLTGVIAVSAGGYQACALTTVGAVKCWGYNGNGDLGNGTTTDSSIPVDVSGLANGVQAISSGAYTTCAITTASDVKCWGYNGQGQLGNGTTTNSSTPVDVPGTQYATATASLSVSSGSLDHIVLSPASATITAGGSQTYSAQGFDIDGNSLGDVTASTVFSVAPDGSCTGATCTATVSGAHTVTGTDGSKTATASLTVGFHITTSSLSGATRGVFYHVQLQATGGATPYKWKRMGKLPKGLKLLSSGILQGTPSRKAAPGNYTFTAQATDATKHHHQVARQVLRLVLS